MQRRPPTFAHALFFPAAALHAALLVPWWTAGRAGLLPLPPGLETPSGHAMEMLSGFAFAVVAGYLLGPQPRRWTLALLGLWLGARVAALGWPGSPAAVATTTLFALGVAVRVVPRFAVAAKKWRNRTIAPVVTLLAIVTAAGAWQPLTGLSSRGILLAGLILLSLLMFFMGGRIIAPALAGQMKRRGDPFRARVQPRLEGTGLVALLIALFCVLPGRAATDRVAAAAIGIAALATLLRVLRWRPWRCIRRPDLMVLVLGHVWLGCGLLLFAGSLATEQALGARIHALTIGALGTLTLAVMARTRLLLLYRDANAAPVVHLAVLLVSAAALTRMAPLLPGPAIHPLPWLLASSLLWSAAFLILFAVLVRPGPQTLTACRPGPSDR
ncbi:MAG: NnrS family protein [Gammaproteobacteria bacterium]|nr:NnrS family protein [Gammaproteobacteria bacterium]